MTDHTAVEAAQAANLVDRVRRETGGAVVYLGNRQAIQLIDDPDAPPHAPQKLRQPIPDAPRKNCTTVVLPPGIGLVEAINNIAGPRGLWRSHSDADAPAWVASTWPELSSLLAAEWGCEIREPDPDHMPSGGDSAPEPSLEV